MERNSGHFNLITAPMIHPIMIAAVLIGAFYFTLPTYSYANDQDTAGAVADAAIAQSSTEDVLDNTINMGSMPEAKSATQKNGVIVLNATEYAPTQPQPIPAQSEYNIPIAEPLLQDNKPWGGSVTPPELFRLISQPYWHHTIEIFHKLPEPDTVLQ